ncbi:hypothetical protein Ais01nite_14590 [Asanoa ishikariensis]|uniref:CU044_5270 family protein n=1 Tax=Asanoa ishikariensis TaxID=137265 RepID=A0A1H3UIJ4_9ACTN|nr:CU044_5270 family protein [Asanoa ishikariensis]GIF63424.1 hypothetical protein Ais01nite_14590 [Asanoa ishikariensis]SDZ62250.1 hypothetical protein SAMN05421684_7414 [Asanoa ishikariensis]
MTNELTALRENWTEVEPPSADAQAKARAALLNRIADQARPAERTKPRHRRLPSWAWRTGLATLTAAAVAAGVVAVGGSGQTPGEQTDYAAGGSVAETFELAAATAETEPFTPPRPDQWTYVELKMVRGKIAVDKGQATSETTRSWQRADGLQTADLLDGKLQVSPETTEIPIVMPPRDYPTLAGLPTQPQALLDWVRAKAAPGKTDHDAVPYSLISAMLRDNVLPPSVKATLLRALALIPGVTRSTDPVDFAGRPAIAVGMVQDGWRQEDILLDPTTHEFLGSRTAVVKDYTTPEGVALKKGDVEVELVRVAGKIVNAPGQVD